MTRDFRSRTNDKRRRARRDSAMERGEIEQPTTPRESAAGPTSMAVKADDPVLRAQIEDAMRRKLWQDALCRITGKPR
jgi:hypothetical protein